MVERPLQMQNKTYIFIKNKKKSATIMKCFLLIIKFILFSTYKKLIQHKAQIHTIINRVHDMIDTDTCSPWVSICMIYFSIFLIFKT